MKKTIEKISETTEGWFFEKVKLRNLQPDLSRKRMKMLTQINKIRNEKLQLMSQKYTDHKRLLQVTCTCVYTQSLSHSFLFATPWTVAPRLLCQRNLPGKEFWNWLPFATPGDLPDLGTESKSLTSPTMAGGFFTPQLGSLLIICQ